MTFLEKLFKKDSGLGLFRRHEKGLLFSALVGTIVFLYFNGLSGAFVWDDRTYFIDNDILPNLSPFDIPAFFTPSNYWGELLPFRDWLYVLQYSLFKQDPFGYHLVSLFLYGVTLWVLLQLLSEWYALAAESAGVEAGHYRLSLIFASLFFAVHPAHVETVAYISSQKDLLAGLFCFLALLFWGRYSRSARLRDLLVFVICYYLSFLSKLSVVFLPLFIPLLSLTLYRRYTQNLRLRFSLFALINFLPLVWVLYVMKTIELVAGSYPQIASISVGDRLVRAVQILGAHSKLAISPYPLNFGYPFVFTGTLGFDFWAGMGALALVGMACYWRKWLICLGGGLFFWGMFPVLQIFNDLNNATVYDRYLFVPVLGLGIVLGEVGNLLAQHFVGWRKVVVGLGAAIIVVLCFLSVNYVSTFASDTASTEHSYDHFPDDSSSVFNYATSLIEAGEFLRAQKLLDKEPSLSRPRWVKGYLLGWIALEQHHYQVAEKLLLESVYWTRLGRYFPYPNVLLAKALDGQGRGSEAISFLEDVVRSKIYNPLEFYRAKKFLEKLNKVDH